MDCNLINYLSCLIPITCFWN